MIDDNTIRRINDAVNILDVISDFEPNIRKTGVNYQCLCPFHQDRHMGSFTISPKKNMCYCFSCEKGGDAVYYLMEAQGMSYPDALRYLGQKYCIEVEGADKFKEVPKSKPRNYALQPDKLPVFTLPMSMYERSTKHLSDDVLVSWLRNHKWGPAQEARIEKVLGTYRVGTLTTRHNEQFTVFWYSDEQGNLCTGKMIRYKYNGDRIRQLQTSGGKRIDDCQFIDGQGRERWHVFCGMDFSSGDDLFALTYLAVDWLPSDTMRGRFFADTDCWVLEKTMNDSPNRPLYEQWVEQGWLHVCPGEVFDSAYAINRIAELVEKGINIYYFGYDPAQSLTPINNLKAWLQTLFQKREGMSTKDIADAIQRMVIPVSQTSFTQNPRITELEEKMLSLDAWMEFSDSPLFPWCFGNCAIESKGDPPIRRIVKGAGQNNKIDPVHALLDALYCFDLGENRISE